VDDDDVEILLAAGAAILIALATLVLIAWSTNALGQPRQAELVLVELDGSETILRGQWVGGEVGEPVRMVADRRPVFGSGFE
jgi:hypothetical protein